MNFLQENYDSPDATEARCIFCNYSCHSIETPGISKQAMGRSTS